MKNHSDSRALGNNTAFRNRTGAYVAPLLGMLLWLVVGCATTRPLSTTETIITDSTTLRTAQRLVAVAVPGDSAKLVTRLAYDEATHQFRPVTFYSTNGHTTLAFSLDVFGQVSAQAVTAPWVAHVPVTDTELTRTRATTTKAVVEKKKPAGGFVRFCIGFTVLCLVGAGLWTYTRFFTPIRLFR